LAGVKGCKGRPRTRDDNDPWVIADREAALAEYYANRIFKLKYSKVYHERIKDYAVENNISFSEARKAGVGKGTIDVMSS